MSKYIVIFSNVGYEDSLSSLEKREALIVGVSISTPSMVSIQEANPTPKSDDVEFYTEWCEKLEESIF